jgi:cobalt-zinc-cadmium efflux system protein
MEKHNHNHHHHLHGGSETKNIKSAMILNLGFAAIEALGGFYINSMAVLSNALHDLGDSMGLGISWYLTIISGKGETAEFSYGYRRFSLLAALITGLIILSGTVIIIYHSIPRLVHPEASNVKGMAIFGVIGVLVNAWAAMRLNKGDTMNERMMMLHMVEDVLGWAAVLVISIVMLVANVPQLDPALAILINLYILWNVVKNLKSTLHIFMQGVPDKIDMAEMEGKILAIEGVIGIHDLHIWTLDGDHHIASLHVVVAKPIGVQEMVKIKSGIRGIAAQLSIDQATIEVECGEKDCMVEIIH